MGQRIQARRSDGRWERGTLEGTLGLRCATCPECQSLNPYGRDPANPFRWERPETCSECGATLPRESNP